MSEFNNQNVYESMNDGNSLKAYMTKVFTNMGIGVGITALVAYLCYRSIFSYGIIAQIFFLGSSAMIAQLLLFVAQIGLVIWLNRAINSLSPVACRALFFVYAALTGVTFGVIPVAYNIGVVFLAFAFAAVLFISCAIIGRVTNVDLSKYQGILFGALISLVVVTVVSIFVPALRSNLLIGYIGLFIFMAYTAFDVQRISHFYYMANDGDALHENLAIYGSLQLYLDFVNMFLYLLRILGRRRN